MNYEHLGKTMEFPHHSIFTKIFDDNCSYEWNKIKTISTISTGGTKFSLPTGRHVPHKVRVFLPRSEILHNNQGEFSYSIFESYLYD